jgi:hypothetical protein
MNATTQTGWSLALFFALVALLKWRHRRLWVEHRINRGLKAYAAAGAADPEGGLGKGARAAGVVPTGTRA